jgi:hypothetical protein
VVDACAVMRGEEGIVVEEWRGCGEEMLAIGSKILGQVK